MPFAEFVKRDDVKENGIENCILSLLLELPEGSYFVDMFAHCFPLVDLSADDKSDKWRGLMQRVRRKLDVYNADKDPTIMSPLKCYRNKSHLRNEQLSDSAFQISPFKITVYQDASLNVELTDIALLVGSWEFEYDDIYKEFLDTVLSILSPIEAAAVQKLNYSVTSLSKDYPTPKYMPPLLGAYHSQRLQTRSYDSWHQLINLVEQVHQWAHLSSTLPSVSSELPSMRVNISCEFLINCLQLYCRPCGDKSVTVPSECEDVPDYPEQQLGQQIGYCEQQIGYPKQKTSFPMQQTEHQTGNPEQHAGYPKQRTGYPEQQTGYPKQQTGCPEQPTGFPEKSIGYTKQQTSLSSVNSISLSHNKTDEMSRDNKVLEAKKFPAPLLQLPVGTLQVLLC